VAERTSGTPRTPASYTPEHLAERILESRAGLEGERKHVTVLFADVVGFTALAERADPEDVHALVDRCFELMLEQVHAFEGTVNQFTGDGVMALFGAPLALEDAPRRAVRAALGIQRALASRREELLASRGVDLRMRIGINSGLVVFGRIGNDLRMETTAVGDTINLASRLQALAAPGAILVSEATHRLVAGFFDSRPTGLLDVKGKSEPVRAYEIVAERRVAGRVDLLAGSGLTRLVGRERELDALHEAFASAAAGRGRVVFLVGEAGIGKSRLLYEFRRRLDGKDYLWVEGRCASYGTGTAFLPIIDALRRYFDLDDRDEEATALDKVAHGVAALGGDLGWTLPFVRQLLSLPPGDAAVDALDAGSRRSETFRALKALTLEASRGRTLVVVIEDLHWIDPASEEYLAFLGDVVPATRALLVCSHRPGYVHPFGDRSYHVRIGLDALSETDTATMTAAILGAADVPAELRALIASKAEGNPFFVEEVTKSLLEDGSLRRNDGRIVLARPLADLAVPDRIQDVLMARIDRLADDPKRAIQVASVIGREFAVRLLERITEAGDRVQALVDELRAVELVYEKAAHPELAYMFKHALTHDVAYESMLLQRRRTLHRMIGEAIEELYADRLAEHYETLAFHFERGEVWERALHYHELAAEKAAEAFANHAVAEHCRQALAIADRLGSAVGAGRRRHLLETLGMATFFVSEFRSSGEAFDAAAGHGETSLDRVVNFGRAAHSHVWAHSYDTARHSLEAARALAASEHLPAADALVLVNEAFLDTIVDGDVERYVRRTSRALELAELSGSEELTALVRFLLAEASEWRGEYAHAIALCEEVLEAARRLRLAHFVIWPKWFIGKAACCLGDYGRAIAELRDAIGHCDRIGDRAWKTRLLNTLGWCFAEIGSHHHARAYNREAAAIARDLGDPEICANADINLACNSLALGDADEADAYLAPIRSALERPGDPWMRWRYRLHVLDATAHVALARRDPEQALRLADEELAGARRHGATKLEARALGLRGAVLLALDRRPDAAHSLNETLTVARRIGYPPATVRALRGLAELARRNGERGDADRRAAEARAHVERLARSLGDDELRRELLRLE
jgi:class 3 adenylate cyclase/tetratricopeptide (TPR) repeat protein